MFLLLCLVMAVVCYENVGSTKMEQQINLKVLVKERKSPTECFKLLKDVYDEDVMSKS